MGPDAGVRMTVRDDNDPVEANQAVLEEFGRATKIVMHAILHICFGELRMNSRSLPMDIGCPQRVSYSSCV